MSRVGTKRFKQITRLKSGSALPRLLSCKLCLAAAHADARLVRTRARPEAYGEVLTALEQPQEKLLQELEIHGHLRYNLCCILTAFQVRCQQANERSRQLPVVLRACNCAAVLLPVGSMLCWLRSCAAQVAPQYVIGTIPCT